MAVFEAVEKGPFMRNNTLAAMVVVLAYSTIIGLVDNFVVLIAAEVGLWQFHAMRSVMGSALFALAAVPMALVLRPKNPRAVMARSALHAVAMLVYFGSLAFLSVAQSVAGLFTAPIFVLIFSRLVFGHPLGPVRIAAVILGFVGVLLVLDPGAQGSLGWASLIPVAAGALYGLGNLATREWCEGESAAVLTLGYFIVIGVAGLVGMGVLAFLAPEAVPGVDGFLLRGAIWPSLPVLFWIAVQAVGSVIAVGLLVRGYQLADASRVSIFEYVLLPISALWSWVIWGQPMTALALLGMGLIVAAGAMIALRGR